MTTVSTSRILAKKALDQAVTELESVVFNMGFQAGWDAALKQLTEARPGPLLSPSSAIVPLVYDYSSSREAVIRFIRENPGKRGSEIVKALSNGANIKENTTRTAINRLKRAQTIRNDDGKWYAIADNDDACVGVITKP
jgi:hypothetical protein